MCIIFTAARTTIVRLENISIRYYIAMYGFLFNVSAHKESVAVMWCFKICSIDQYSNARLNKIILNIINGQTYITT